MTAHSKTKKTASVSTVDASAPVTAPVTAPTATASNPPASATSPMKLPPADANIPAPPQGFVPTNGTDYRGLLPKKTELAVLPDAVAELKDFASFALTFGRTMPSLATVLGVLDSAAQWSSMRAKSTEWDLYCRTQEGLAWKDARGLIGTMKPAFAMATSVDATIASENPSIVRLLAANTTIALRGAATRRANRLLVEEGKPPTKGKVGKKAKKAAAEAVPVAPVASAPAAVAPAGVANGVVNGAGH